MPFLFQKHIYLYIFLSFVWFLKGVLYVSMCVSLNLREGPGHTPEFVPKTMCRAKYKLWYYFFFKFGAFFFFKHYDWLWFYSFKVKDKKCIFQGLRPTILSSDQMQYQKPKPNRFFFPILHLLFFAIFVIDTIDKPIKRQNILV